MRTRRTRKIKRGGVGFGDIGNFFTGKTNQPVQSPMQGQDQMQGAPLQDNQEGAPMPDEMQGAPMPDEMQGDPLPDEMQAGPVQDEPSGNSIIDQRVKDIAGLTGYHMRAIINAISVCNSTMKMQNNAAGVGNSVLNAFGRGNEAKLEMSKCGSQCKARSDAVKVALNTLSDISKDSDVLGFIASQRAMGNSASYVGNSMASLGNRGATQASQAASSVGNAASNAASSVGNFFSGLTRKATQPQTTGGRRRKRTRR